MGLLDTLKSWLGLGDDADDEADAPIDDTPPEEPKLDPSGANETRIKTSDTAVDALKQTRSEMDEMDESDAGGETNETRSEK